MAKTKQQIIEDIRGYIQKRGGKPGEWQVDVGTKERACLFKAHDIRERGDCWIVRRAESPQAAREASIDLSGSLRSAVSGTAAESADFVYAFRKATDDSL